MAYKPRYYFIPNHFYHDSIVVNQDFIITGYKDVVGLPGWRALIKAGGNATNNYAADLITPERTEAINVVHKRWLRVFYQGANSDAGLVDTINWFGFPLDMQARTYLLDHAGTVSTEDDATALSRLYSKIRNSSYGVNTPLILGELAETIRLLRSPARLINELLDDYDSAYKIHRLNIHRRVKRRKGESLQRFVKRRANALKDALAGSWLAFQFGIKPLVSDVEDTLKTAHRILSESRRQTRFRSRSNPSYTARNDFSTVSLIAENLKSSTYSQTNTTSSVQYVVGMNQSLSAPGVSGDAGWASEFGFQIQNFVPTIYELIPFSFLVDYYVNLGNVITAVCTSTTGFSWGAKTVKQDTDLFLVESLFTFESESFVTQLSGATDASRSFRHVSLQRTKLDSIPLPQFVFSVPGEDSLKWANQLALIAKRKFTAF